MIFSLFNKFIYLFIYLWPHWVLVAACGLSLVAASEGHSLLRCAGLSPWWPLPLRSMGPRRVGSAVVARGLQSTGSAVGVHGPSCSMAHGILPDQRLNLCPLHWQRDSQPLRYQEVPQMIFMECAPLSAWTLPHANTYCASPDGQSMVPVLEKLPRGGKMCSLYGKCHTAISLGDSERLPGGISRRWMVGQS